MKIGCNYINELTVLGIYRNIDYVKVPSFCSELTGLDWIKNVGKDMIFHGFAEFGPNIGNPDFIKKLDVESVKRYIKDTNTEYLSVHFDMDSIYYKKIEKNEIELSEIIKMVTSNINFLRKEFNLEVHIENVSAKNGRPECFFNPDVITEVIRKTNCNFLFDLSHAITSAGYYDISVYDYIKKLPMFTVKEIHVSGTLMNKEKKLIDSHTRLVRRDYKIIESLLDKFKNIDKITLEYTPLYDKQKDTKKKFFVTSRDNVNVVVFLNLLFQLKKLKKILKHLRNH